MRDLISHLPEALAADISLDRVVHSVVSVMDAFVSSVKPRILDAESGELEAGEEREDVFESVGFIAVVVVGGSGIKEEGEGGAFDCKVAELR